MTKWEWPPPWYREPLVYLMVIAVLALVVFMAMSYYLYK